MQRHQPFSEALRMSRTLRTSTTPLQANNLLALSTVKLKWVSHGLAAEPENQTAQRRSRAM
jgi:hypothetical protein